MTREEAIIRIKDHIEIHRYYERNAVKIFEALEMAIKALEQPEIIRCKDCKYQSKGQNESETWNLCGYRPWQYTPTTDKHFCGYAKRR